MALTNEELSIGESHPNSSDFDVQEYIARRTKDPGFLMVEIGHGGTPVAYRSDFTNRRAYIGIESWLRDPYHMARDRIEVLKQEQPEINAFYLSHDPGGEVVREEESEVDAYYIGDYEPTTVLSEGIASEVFLSNVFCDPLVAWRPGSTEKLLAESARLVEDEGVVVARETITPTYAELSEETLNTVGLHALKRIHSVSGSEQTWNKLEKVYNGDLPYLGFRPTSFYLFMAKV